MCFESFDWTLRDLMKCDLPFGGKFLVLGGDFRQILLVIPGGDSAIVINATINSSHLWDFCTVFKLTQNMRLNARDNIIDKILIIVKLIWIQFSPCHFYFPCATFIVSKSGTGKIVCSYCIKCFKLILYVLLSKLNCLKNWNYNINVLILILCLNILMFYPVRCTGYFLFFFY